MNRIITGLQSLFETNVNKFTTQGLVPPKTVDIYLGQTLNPEQFEFETPAIFIDFSIDYRNSVAYIYLHSILDFGEDSENFANDPDAGLNYIRYLKTIKRVVKGYRQGKPFGVFRLTQDNPVSQNLFHYHRIDIECNLYDDPEEDQYELANLDVDIERGTLIVPV